jgi:hypothetical protein
MKRIGAQHGFGCHYPKDWPLTEVCVGPDPRARSKGKPCEALNARAEGDKLEETEILGLVKNLGIARNLFRVMAC